MVTKAWVYMYMGLSFDDDRIYPSLLRLELACGVALAGPRFQCDWNI
jgi:hypothetical protein